MFEREYRDLAHVPRWGILPVNRRQSVAEHSYFVTLYASHICLIMGLEDKILRDTLLHCVEHDRSEVYTSDIPGPVKRAMGDKTREKQYILEEDALRFTTNDHSKNKVAVTIRKMADLMDEFAYLSEELHMGNQRVLPAMDDVKVRLNFAAAKVAAMTGNNPYDTVLVPFLEECSRDKVMPRVENSDVAA